MRKVSKFQLKKTIGDYLINTGASEGMNPRKKVPGRAVDHVDMVIKYLVT